MKKNSTEQHKQAVLYLEDAYKIRVSDLEKSIKLAKKALSIFRSLNDKSLVAKSLSHLSLFYMIKGEMEEAMSAADRALVLYTELKDEKGLADVKYNMAGVYYKTDNLHLGLAYLIDCLPIYKKYKDYFNLARTEKSLGTIYEFIGDENNAIKSYENSIDAAKKAGDVNLKSNVYNPLSGIYLKKGEIKKALELIQRAIDIKKASGDIRGLGFALYGRGKVLTRTGEFEQAEKDFKEALKIHMAAGDKLGTAMANRKMGVMYEKMGETAKAIRVLKNVFKFSADHNIAIIKFKAAYHLYALYKKQKDIKLSLKYLEEYIVQREAVINTQTLQVIENYEVRSNMERLERETQLQKEKDEIIKKKDLAEQASRIRQDFLSTMSHEIRTPLNAVTTISSLLKDRSEPEEQQLLESLRFASGNLLQIINDILDFTKLEADKSQLEYRAIGLRKLIQNLYGTYKSMATEKGLELLLDIDKNIAQGYELDETKLMQIMGNLVSNAVKYTEEGKVNISVQCIAPGTEYDTLRFSVKDTGVGIAPKNLKRVFEEFFQPEAVTTRKEKGTGLGLAIVKKLVSLYGSKIQAKSTLGKGSEFYFELKLKRAAPEQQAQEKEHEKLKGKTMLLAEDNPINAMVATKLLGSWGVQTTHVVNGQLAVEKAAERKYDFILMDLHMPVMNGYDATLEIRTTKGENANTPIYALTADITADQHKEFALLFSGFLRKPIEIENMYEALTAF